MRPLKVVIVPELETNTTEELLVLAESCRDGKGGS
jgi:hypothetical protein